MLMSLKDALKVDKAKVGESKQIDFVKWGGSTETVRFISLLIIFVFLFVIILFVCFRNLCIWEDMVKYLLKLEVNSAYYDPKTCSMWGDPLLADADRNKKFLDYHAFVQLKKKC